MRFKFIAILFFWFCSSFSAAIDDQAIAKAAKALVDSGKTAAISVAVIQPSGVRFFTFGESRLGNRTPMQLHTMFEIGSISKGLSGIILAQAVLEGKIKLSDSVQNWLPNFKIPKGNRAITILDLATHHSGLPSEMDNQYRPIDPLNPWAQFTTEELKKSLNRMTLKYQPGTVYEYSNVGAALIGYILEALYRKPYEEILNNKLLFPLGLKDTTITLSMNQKLRMANGYYKDKSNFVLIPTWEMPGIVSAGAIRSSMHDLISLAQNLMKINSKFSEPVSLASRIFSMGPPQMTKARSGLFWLVVPDYNYFWHSGATYGKASFLGINSKKQSAVIVLSNTSNNDQAETLLGVQIMTHLSR